MIFLTWLQARWLEFRIWLLKLEARENDRMMVALTRRIDRSEGATDKEAALATVDFMKEAWKAGWFIKLFVIGRLVLVLLVPVAIYALYISLKLR
jgi:hypothetical protein